MDTYVPIDLCGTPSTESNDTFFPWDWTIIDYDAIEVTFETDILGLNEEWPKNKPRHSGIAVNFRCMTGNKTSPFPYSARFLEQTRSTTAMMILSDIQLFSEKVSDTYGHTNKEIILSKTDIRNTSMSMIPMEMNRMKLPLKQN